MSINEELVSEYAEAMKNDVEFPPVVVFWDGVANWLADGFHRIHAARKAELETFEADRREGTKRDAILYSVGANAAHGSRRTNDDKRKAVMTLLEDEEWSQWSNVEIAKRCAVSDMTVKRCRDELSHQQSGSDAPPPRTYTTKHGTKAKMNTGGIGKGKKKKAKKKDEPPPENNPKPEPLGIGLRKATEAIDALGSIPKNDKLRQAAFDRVIDWINTHR